MTQNLLFNLFSELWTDLHAPDLLWQLVALLFCGVVGWTLAYSLRGRLFIRNFQIQGLRFGEESFVNVLSPLFALILIVAVIPILSHWYKVNLLKLVIPLVTSFALIRLSFYILRQVFARGGNRSGNFLLVFEKMFAVVIWSGVALYITGGWPDLFKYFEQTLLPMGRYKVSLLTILQVGVTVIITLILALWFAALLEARLMRIDTMHSSLRTVMARTGRALFILIAVLFSLSLVGVDLTILSVFGGALGVGLGLGLQKIVSSYVSGFVILLERSLSIGDMVVVDKYSGQVTQINTRYTIVRSFEGVETVVPNEMLVSGPVQNYSLTDRTLRLASRIVVGYQTDIDELLPLMEKVAASVGRVLKVPAPQALLVKFEPDGFEVEVGFWINDLENGRLNVLSEVNRVIWKMLQLHRIQIPYPQREVRLINVANHFEGKSSMQ